jgi:hypothetical protein
MDTWVKDVIGLTFAFDSVCAIGIIGWCAWASYVYEHANEYIYKNYNYTMKDGVEVKDESTSN